MRSLGSANCAILRAHGNRSPSEVLIEFRYVKVSLILERLVEGQLPRRLDHTLLAWRRAVQLLDLTDDLHALEHGPEDDVLAIEVGRLHSRDEELAAVGVFARVGHGELASTRVLEHEVLVLELLPVDRLATSAVALGEVATLDHEVLDHSVKLAPLVAEALLASGQRAEVLGGLRHSFAVETHNDAPSVLAADGHVEVDL